MKPFLIPALASVLCVNAFASDEHYQYQFVNKTNNTEIVLSFKKSSVNQYPGWKHGKNKMAHVSIWYPSLLDASSPNTWMSTVKEQQQANIKPNKNDRKLKLAIGSILGNYITSQQDIEDKKSQGKCNLDRSFVKFEKVGQVGAFEHYQTVGGNNTLKTHTYLPDNTVKGIGCVICNGITCQQQGISDLGISYLATQSDKQMQMINEALEIHDGVNRYLNSKKI